MPDIMVRNKHWFKKHHFHGVTRPWYPCRQVQRWSLQVNEAEGQVKAWTATALVVFSGGRLNMFFLCQPKGTNKTATTNFYSNWLDLAFEPCANGALYSVPHWGCVLVPQFWRSSGDFCTVMHESAMPALNNTEIPVFDGKNHGFL